MGQRAEDCFFSSLSFNTTKIPLEPKKDFGTSFVFFLSGQAEVERWGGGLRLGIQRNVGEEFRQ